MGTGNDIIGYNASVPAPSVVYAYPEWLGEEESGFSLNLADIKALLWRQRYWVGGVVALCLAAGAAISFLMTPIYRATASIQVEPNAAIVDKGQEAVEPQVTTQNQYQYMQAQVDVLKSRALAERVSHRLGLAQRPDFVTAMKLDRKKLAGKALADAAAAALEKNIGIDLPLGSQTVRISFDSASPTISALIANAYSENLITGNLERRFEASSYARDFLLKEMTLAKQRLEESERAAVAYAREAQIVDTGGTQAAGATGGGGKGSGGNAAPSLSATNLMQMNADLGSARSARIQAEQRWRTASATPLMGLPEVIENTTVQQLQAERARLASALSKARQTFKDDYPEIGKMRSEIAGIDTEISSIAQQVRNGIKERYDVAARQESAMAGRIGGLKADTLQEQDRRVRYDILNREAETNRQLYSGLLQRFREVSTAAGVANNNISILDRAIAPGLPVRPKPLVNLALALLAGLGLGILVAFIRDRLDDTIRTPDEIDRKLDLPLLGTTPALPAIEVASQLALGNSSISEAYHSIRSSVEFAADGLPKSLLVTSSRPGEGKSTTAVAIAADFARFGHRVLLIDADLRVPSLHKLLQVSNEVGLVNVLTGKASMANALHDLGDVHFLPSGPIPPNPSQVLAPQKVAAFLKVMRDMYDVVVIDGPPVMGLADAPQLGRTAEGTLLVVEAARASRGHAKTAIKRLRAAKANLIGVVLTKFSARASGYNNDYGYYYYYGFKDAKNLDAA